MMNRYTIRRVLLASSLAGGALIAGCGSEAPGESGELTVTNKPVLVERASEAAPTAGEAAPSRGETAPTAAETATAFTLAEDSNTYAVYVRQGDAARKAGSVQVAGHVNELTVEVNATPSGERVAVVPNYDTYAGTELRILDRSGPEHVLESARVASPVWSPDGAELAYLVMREGSFEVRVSDGAKPGRVIGNLQALRARLLGWSDEKEELYVIMDTYQGGNAPVVSFGVVDMNTGELRTTFATDKASSTYYRDFQLVRGEDGTQLVSFVKATTEAPCGGTSRLELSTVNGALLSTHGESTDSYSQARWSADGTKVAYEVRACVDKMQGLAKAEQRMQEVNGIHVAEVGQKASKRIATGLLHDFRLAGLRKEGVVLGSSSRGQEIIEGAASKVVDLYQLEAVHPTLGTTGTTVIPGMPGMTSIAASQLPPANAKNVPTQYVHQLWDTPNWHDGNSSCGPTSAVMDLAGYQLGAWPITVSVPTSHTSNYGNYVASQYTYAGFTFSTGTYDPSGGVARGAYGHMVKASNQGSTWAYISSFLDKHLTWAVAEAYGNIGGNWVKQQLNGNLLVVTSGSVFGYGHIIIIRGYTDDGRWIVNDPYGFWAG
jgi:hypothetical protein